jgi:hypothetical protein
MVLIVGIGLRILIAWFSAWIVVRVVVVGELDHSPAVRFLAGRLDGLNVIGSGSIMYSTFWILINCDTIFFA